MGKLFYDVRPHPGRIGQETRKAFNTRLETQADLLCAHWSERARELSAPLQENTTERQARPNDVSPERVCGHFVSQLTVQRGDKWVPRQQWEMGNSVWQQLYALGQSVGQQFVIAPRYVRPVIGDIV